MENNFYYDNHSRLLPTTATMTAISSFTTKIHKWIALILPSSYLRGRPDVGSRRKTFNTTHDRIRDREEGANEYR